MAFGDATGIRGKFIFNPKTKELEPYEKPQKIIAPEVITDELSEPVVSHATHKKQIFTSKRAYRKHLAVHGFRETGGDHLHTPSRSDIKREQEREDRERREDMEKAYFDVKYGRVEFTEAEKERHRREERLCKMNNIPTKMRAPY